MAFFTGVTIYKAVKGIDFGKIEAKDGLSVTADVAVVVVAAIFCALAAAGIFPHLQGIAQQAVVYSLGIGAGVIVAALITNVIIRYLCTRHSKDVVTKEVVTKEVQNPREKLIQMIKQAGKEHTAPNDLAIQESLETPMNGIIPFIFLGNNAQFAKLWVQDSNFRTVITTTPIRYTVLSSIPVDTIPAKLKRECKINWIYVGDDHNDSNEKVERDPWKDLLSQSTQLECIDQSELPVKQWFFKVFQAMDEACEEHWPLLIHDGLCSNGTALLAAYLINRYEVTPQEAFAFIQSKRPCVEFTFEKELTDYYNRLYKAEEESEELDISGSGGS
jgi:hypothetical protein